MARPRKPTALQTTNWLELFLEFISHLTVDSKETGVGALMLYNSQKRFLAEMIKGLENDIHYFVNLKARQLGISTINLAIDLFWLGVHPGLQGALVIDTEGNRNKFRQILTRYLASLPASYHLGVKQHNRDMLVLENGSVLDYIVAGTRRTANETGRSRAYNFMHASEVSNYGSAEGMTSLLATLAETNPNRLYIFESTAKGYNLFWRMYQHALTDPLTEKAFFIGWWAKEIYSFEETSEMFKRYWDGLVSEEEQERINKVWEDYGVKITPGQLAWYRWKTEKEGSTGLMDQNYPWHADDAFLSTGFSFFPQRKLQVHIARLSESPPPYRGYAYEFGPTFMDTKMHEVTDPDDAQLKVYEPPTDEGEYAIGVDPAYGRSQNQDRTVIQIARCYADRLVQVAEFASAGPDSREAAWVLAHLAGIYRNSMMIVEISGPGEATVLEMKHIRELFDAGALPVPGNGTLEDIFGAARWYMYHRSDSPGPGYAYNWKASEERNFSIMTQVRDSLILDMLEIRSVYLAMEMQGLQQEGWSIMPAISTDKDDRIYAFGYAHRAWTDWIRKPMIDRNDTWERVTQRELAQLDKPKDTMVSAIVSQFFQSKEVQREEAALDAMWEDNE